MAEAARAATNPYKLRAQTRKACAIADVLIERGIVPEAMGYFNGWQREQVEAAAGVTGSSPEVWTMARTIVEFAYARRAEPVPLEIPARL